MTDRTKQRLRERFERILADTDARPQTTIDDLEAMLLELQKQTAAAVCEEVSQEKNDAEKNDAENNPEQNNPEQDPADAGDAPTKVACPHCAKGNAWYKGERTRHVLTRAGLLSLVRRYYHCRRCKKGTCPSDAARALPKNTRFTTGVAQEVALLSASLPFEQVAKTLLRLCHLVLSPASAQRLCRDRAHPAARDFVKA